jgi:ketosteroid isomerase-like protein
VSLEAITAFIDGLPSAFRAGDPAADAKADEEANVRRVQELYRAIGRGDLAAFGSQLADEVELEIVGPAAIPFNGRWAGRDAVVAAVRDNFGKIEWQRPDLHTVAAQGDTVVAAARERGRVRGAARDYDMHWVQVYTFRDGRIVRMRQIAAEALD